MQSASNLDIIRKLILWSLKMFKIMVFHSLWLLSLTHHVTGSKRVINGF